MGLFSFFNQLNGTTNQHGESNLTQNLKKNKDKPITYENLRCSNIPKELRNLFFGRYNLKILIISFFFFFFFFYNKNIIDIIFELKIIILLKNSII